MKKKIFLSALLLGTAIIANAQTLFVPNGTAGIGTSSNAGKVGFGTSAPAAKISFNNVNDGSNGPDGITWYNPSPFDYGIHRTSGPWSGPAYQQLRVSWQTGMILDPGTTTSKCYVDVQGNGLRVSSGTVGIGTISPYANLHVVGNSVFTANSGAITYAPYIRGNNTPSTALTPDYTWYNNDQTGLFLPGANIIGFSIGGNEKLRITDAGLSIGSTSFDANYLLSVNGKIRAKEIKVYTAWADFVFADTYKLMSLKDIEAYIKTNNHLPEIPSASEVEKEGISVGEMQSRLLQKIEELTLHMIEQNKQIEALKIENEKMKESIYKK